MKLYLSSYKVGSEGERFKSLVGKSDATVAVIDNALDYSTDEARKATSLQSEFDDMQSLGFTPAHLDLKEYFGRSADLVGKLSQFDAVWVRGGNTFLLRKAMEQSGFSQVFEELVKTNKLTYAGYSAGVCVLAPSLRGVELVDDPYVEVDGYEPGIIWEGYGIIDFYPVVHYKSDHPESPLVDNELEYIESKGLKYELLRDGEVIVIDTN